MKFLILLLLFTGLYGANNATAQDAEPPFGYPPLTVFSLFQEEHRNQAYDMAIIYGRYIIKHHPTQLDGHPRYRGDANFRRMIDIYNHYAEETSDPTIRDAYLDSSIQLYNQVFEIFPDESYFDEYRWVFNQGRFYQTYASHIDNGMNKAYENYERLFELDPQRTTETANGYYVQITLQHLVRRGHRERALKMMEIAEPYAGDDLKRFFDDTRNDLFSDPKERITFLEGQLENDPGNIGLIKELFELHNDEGNRSRARALARKLYENDANYENTMRMADLAERNDEYRDAIRFLNEAIQKTQDRTKRKEIHIQISDNYYSLRELENARDAARRAVQIDQNWGEPYLKIANIYSQAVRECAGREIGRRDKVVYWLVLDYLDKAREVDSSTANQVRRQYGSFEAATPSAEEKFYQGWEAGNTIKVDNSLRACYSWINEETTVR